MSSESHTPATSSPVSEAVRLPYLADNPNPSYRAFLEHQYLRLTNWIRTVPEHSRVTTAVDLNATHFTGSNRLSFSAGLAIAATAEVAKHLDEWMQLYGEDSDGDASEWWSIGGGYNYCTGIKKGEEWPIVTLLMDFGKWGHACFARTPGHTGGTTVGGEGSQVGAGTSCATCQRIEETGVGIRFLTISMTLTADEANRMWRPHTTCDVVWLQHQE